MITVTGASGQLGRAIVERLLDHVAAAEVVAATVRDPAKAADLEARVSHPAGLFRKYTRPCRPPSRALRGY